MSWALKRQIFYVGIVILFFSAILFYFIYPYINKPPTCSDGKLNGKETGIDCGGSCPLACKAEVDKLAVLWSRTFPVGDGKYNAVAYIENLNKNQAIDKIKYRFRFSDSNNLYIGEKEGKTFVPVAGKFAIFEQDVNLGNSIPVYTTFEFIEEPQWINIDESIIDDLKIVVSNINLDKESNVPRLSANLKNNSTYIITNFSAIAILYDKFKNALFVSNTYFPLLKSEEEINLNYTWRDKIDKEIVDVEIIPMYNVFGIKLK